MSELAPKIELTPPDIEPYRAGTISNYDELWTKAKAPVRDFMFNQIEATASKMCERNLTSSASMTRRGRIASPCSLRECRRRWATLCCESSTSGAPQFLVSPQSQSSTSTLSSRERTPALRSCGRLVAWVLTCFRLRG